MGNEAAERPRSGEEDREMIEASRPRRGTGGAPGRSRSSDQRCRVAVCRERDAGIGANENAKAEHVFVVRERPSEVRNLEYDMARRGSRPASDTRAADTIGRRTLARRIGRGTASPSDSDAKPSVRDRHPTLYVRGRVQLVHERAA